MRTRMHVRIPKKSFHCKLQYINLLSVLSILPCVAYRASDVNSPVDVNSPLFGSCQFDSINMEYMS